MKNTTNIRGTNPTEAVVVPGDTPVLEAIAKMEESSNQRIGVERKGDASPVILLSEESLGELLLDLDSANKLVAELKQQIDQDVSRQFDLMQEGIKSVADNEKHKLDLAFECISDGLIILGRDGSIERANRAAKRLLGESEDISMESLRNTIDDLGLIDVICQSVDGDGCDHREFNLKSGDERVLQMHWHELVGDSDNSLGVAVVICDLTDEIAGEKAKSDFIAAISHELRTPLTSIQNSVSNILAGVTGRLGDKTRGYLNMMKIDCERYSSLVGDLLNVSKLETGNIPLNRRVINVGIAIDECLDSFRDIALDKEVELTSEAIGHITPIFVDRQRFGQLLSNLIDNAIQSCCDGDNVIAGAYETPDSVVLTVEDTGSGISASDQQHIFDNFYQANRQSGAGYRGSGLGLPICMAIVKAHGGSIWVESEEGKGSRFYFSIPKIKPCKLIDKHLQELSEKIGEDKLQPGVIFTKIESVNADDNNVKIMIEKLIRHLISDCTQCLNGKGNLVVQIDDDELVLIVEQGTKRTLEEIVNRIRSIVKDRLEINALEGSILPVLGVATYPDDTCKLEKLVQIARENAKRIC